MNLLIVEDHPVVVDGWLLQLKHLAPECRVRQASTWPQAHQALMQSHHQGLAFDWVILDVDLSWSGGVVLPPLSDRIRACAPSVVWVSSFLDTPDIRQVCEALGAQVVPKSIASARWQRLIKAQIQALRDSKDQLPSGLSRVAEPLPHAMACLTSRQLEVLAQAAKGLRNAEIATELKVSEETVRTHLHEAFRLLGVHNRTQACQRYWDWWRSAPHSGPDGT